MHPAIIIGTVRSLIVDVAMGQIPRSTERISSLQQHPIFTEANVFTACHMDVASLEKKQATFFGLSQQIYISKESYAILFYSF